MDFNLWNIIESGFEKSSKPMNEWNDLEKKTFSLNTKVMNALFCALDKNELHGFLYTKLHMIFDTYSKSHTKAQIELKSQKLIFWFIAISYFA